MKKTLFTFCCYLFCATLCIAQRIITNLDADWRFYLNKTGDSTQPALFATGWRTVQLPHDWSIELPFDKDAPATNQGGALPGGLGWYSKSFTLPPSANEKQVFIEFDGVYRNSEVWINGHWLGKRPNGYISFRYDLTPHLNFGKDSNIIVVKADNSQQPNSRWYSGSGIYRHVRLVTTQKLSFAYNSIFISTQKVDDKTATLTIKANISNPSQQKNVQLRLLAYDASGKQVAIHTTLVPLSDSSISQSIIITSPRLWSPTVPQLYKVKTQLVNNGKIIDEIITQTGIRTLAFDSSKGFSLNGKPMKILGVCMHHDLGALGTAVNWAAINRQLKILKEMGCNAIRTAHNPPAPEFLDACDSMGFLVMDEAFDMWAKKKNKYDYYADFPQWHQPDLENQIKRDRNHPSIILWSIGNEIREQFDSTGITIAKELVGIVKKLDATRPVTCALSEADPAKNFIYQSGALDVIGLNYHPEKWDSFPIKYPGQKMIASETGSTLASRGHYDMPSDSIRYWPANGKQKFVENGNPNFTVSAYDNVAAYWGSTHEQTWRLVKKHPFISGLFVWSGFDFLGEPVPYPWPARSSYYGIIDLAGFPKDAYYLYQSEWTNKPMLHLFPHWNWPAGKLVDVWAYYNSADEAELFLNGKSLGIKRKGTDSFHVMWRVPFKPGKLLVVSRKGGKTVLKKTITTAGPAYQIELTADRKIIQADGKDLCYITARITDKAGNLVPDAAQNITFSTTGAATIVAVDNGNPAGLEPLKAKGISAYKGMALGIVQSSQLKRSVIISATAPGLQKGNLIIAFH